MHAAAVAMLAGCTPAPVPPAALARPGAALMAPPAKLADVKGLDDRALYEGVIVCRAAYGVEATKLRGLQAWATAVTGGGR